MTNAAHEAIVDSVVGDCEATVRCPSETEFEAVCAALRAECDHAHAGLGWCAFDGTDDTAEGDAASWRVTVELSVARGDRF